MDIHVTFSTPQLIDDTAVCELTVTADKLVLADRTLRALREGAVVAEAAVTDIAVIDLLTRRSVSTVRERHPNAYTPWSEADDDLLQSLAREGADLATLTTRFGRGKNAILARLLKLGLFPT